MKTTIRTLLAAGLSLLITIGLPRGAAAQTTGNQISDGLVGWWPGQGNANDVVNGNNGVVVGDVWFAPGPGGLAFDFRGSGFVSVPEAPAFDFGPEDSWTALAWVYRTGGASVEHIFGKRSGCGLGANFYQAAIGPGALSLSDVPLGQWTLVAVTYDRATETFKQWANDQVRLTKVVALNPQNDADLRIGTSGDCAQFDGLLHDMMIFDRALSQQEMTLLFNQGSSAVSLQPSLTILYHGDQTMSLSWTGLGTLEQSDSLLAPNWQPAPSQANPQTNNTTGPMMFYRVKAN